jgi:hypothetical protein
MKANPSILHSPQATKYVPQCKWPVLIPQKNEVKYLDMHLDRRREAHQVLKETAQPKSETNALATRKKINTVNRKQTPHIRCSTQTHTDLWNLAMGDSLQFQHQNPPALSIQEPLIHSERTLVHKQPQDPPISTNEHSAQ